MKKLSVLVALSFFMVIACKNENKQENISEEITEESETSIGGETDEHGCLIAAGETWSQLKESCVQIFNEGKRLNPTEINEGESDAVFSAFVLMNEDESLAELFLPNEDSTIILEKTEESVYENETYSYNPETSTLSINGEQRYSGN